jgi:hypothetical protein
MKPHHELEKQLPEKVPGLVSCLGTSIPFVSSQLAMPALFLQGWEHLAQSAKAAPAAAQLTPGAWEDRGLKGYLAGSIPALAYSVFCSTNSHTFSNSN